MRAAAIVTNLESLTWPSDDENDNNDEESKKEWFDYLFKYLLR